MALQHDNEGFLTGPRQEIDHAAYARHLDILREIRSDTQTMAGDLSAIRKSLAPSRPVAPPRASNSPIVAQTQLAAVIRRAQSAARGADGRFVTTKAVTPSTGASPAVSAIAPTPKAVAAGGDGQERKANGRFGRGERDGNDSDPDPDKKRNARDDRESSHVLSTAAESLKRTAGEMISGTAQVDPSIAAAKEVGEIASPVLSLLKPLGGIFKRKPKDDSDSQSIPWYRRMWGELREINKKSGGGKSGGLLAGLNPLSLLGKVPGAGLVGTLLKGAGSLLGRGGRGAAGMLGRGAGFLGKMGGGLLKRVPILGALLSGGSALASIFGADDPSKSAEENRKGRFTGGGAGIGSLIGGGLGMLLGPIGSIAGAAIGDIVGKQVGEWLSTVNWEQVGKTIGETWTATADWFKSAWGKVTDLATGAFDAVKAWATGKLEKVTTAVTNTVNAAKDVGAKAASKASAVKEAAVVAGGRLIGALDPGYRHKESFDGIQGGEGLAKNGSYTNDEADRIRELKSGGFNTSANLKGGMPADIRKKIEEQAVANGLNPKDMVAMAAMESGGNANAISSTGAVGVYQFTGKTATGVGISNRFNADQNIAGGMQLAKTNQDYLVKHGLPVTPENLYMMHQLGPSAASEIIQGAQDGKRIDQLSQGAQFGVRNNYGAGSVTAADYLAKNTKALDDRYNLVAGGPAASSAKIASTATVPTVPATLAPISVSASPVSYAPTAPDLMKYATKDAPSLVKPIGSSANGGQATVRVDSPLTQNLSDRSIAAVATGGIGMTGTL